MPRSQRPQPQQSTTDAHCRFDKVRERLRLSIDDADDFANLVKDWHARLALHSDFHQNS
jgi:hypothetical protein